MAKEIQRTEIYQRLVDIIGVTIESARQKAIQAVNNETVLSQVSDFPVSDWKINMGDARSYCTTCGEPLL